MRRVTMAGVLLGWLAMMLFAACGEGGMDSTQDVAGQGASSSADGHTPPVLAPPNPSFLRVIQQPALLRGADVASGGHALGYRPSPLNLDHTTGQAVSFGPPRLTAFDSSYDLRTTGRITSVKNQGDCGSCWSFATWGALESYLRTGETWNFSENHLKNTHGFDWLHCAGGNREMSAAYILRQSGPVNETDDPYSETSNVSPSGKTVRKYVKNIIFIPNRGSYTGNDAIKSAVTMYGAVMTSMRWEDAAFKTSTNSYYYGGSDDANHGVAIVGWNDNYAASNFATLPPGKGAFIIKNSWGGDWGDGGYFYVSYYDTRIATYNAVFIDAQTAAPYSHVYQYDPLGWVNSMGVTTDSTMGWMANIFTGSADETLLAIGVYAATNDSTYEVRLYDNPSSTPTSGTFIGSVGGTIAASGYATISVASLGLSIKPGRKFAVVVKLTTPGYIYPVPLEYPLPSYSSQATASSGQSYYSANGSNWYDLTLDIPNANVALKAYGGAVVDCNDNNPCTTDSWNGSSCDHTNLASGSLCGDAATECSNQDTCDSEGVCQPNHKNTTASCGDAPAACHIQDHCNGAGACVNGGLVADNTPCADDKTYCNGTETCQSGQCVSGGNPCVPPMACHEMQKLCYLPNSVVINEIDYDQPGTDNAEFVELKNNSNSIVDLNGYFLAFITGSNGSKYAQYDLSGLSIAPGGYVVLCGSQTEVPNCSKVIAPATDLIQNGAPDAVALMLGETVIDTVSYEGNTTGFTEGSGSGLNDRDNLYYMGISRYPDGVDTNNNATDFSPRCVTPGTANSQSNANCRCGDNTVDKDESCDLGPLNGAAASCCTAACAYKSVGASCGDTTTTVCNLADACNATGVCLPNYAATNVRCRLAVGDCDIAEYCDGAGACPVDGFVTASTPCGSGPTECSGQDTCNGSGVCLRNDAATITPCGDVGSECVNQDYCDGNGSCADKGYKIAGMPCGDFSDTLCDNPDTCDGSGTCKANNEPATKECRASGGLCDPAELCDGVGHCPEDVRLATGDPCGSGPSPCASQGYCTATGACAIEYQPSGAPCGDAASACVNQDYCNDKGDCIDHGFKPKGTACGDPTVTICDDADACDETGVCQSNEKPDGADCDDGDGCNGLSACSGGQCVEAVPPLVCTPSDPCRESSCNRDTGTCQESGAKPDGAFCDKGEIGAKRCYGDQCRAVDQGEVCDAPIKIDPDVIGEFSTKDRIDTFTPSSDCIVDAQAGPELFFTATLAAGSYELVVDPVDGVDVLILNMDSCDPQNCAHSLDEAGAGGAETYGPIEIGPEDSGRMALFAVETPAGASGSFTLLLRNLNNADGDQDTETDEPTEQEPPIDNPEVAVEDETPAESPTDSLDAVDLVDSTETVDAVDSADRNDTAAGGGSKSGCAGASSTLAGLACLAAILRARRRRI